MSTITKCSSCGGEVASNARRCPHCGATGPATLGFKGQLFVLALIVAIVILAIGFLSA